MQYERRHLPAFVFYTGNQGLAKHDLVGPACNRTWCKQETRAFFWGLAVCHGPARAMTACGTGWPMSARSTLYGTISALLISPDPQPRVAGFAPPAAQHGAI